MVNQMESPEPHIRPEQVTGKLKGAEQNNIKSNNNLTTNPSTRQKIIAQIGDF